MRMWSISPSLLCDRHLLAEHREIHMLRGYIHRPGHAGMIRGMMEKSLLLPYDLVVRHNLIAKEFRNRGFRHRTTLTPYETQEDYGDGFICPLVTAVELVRRCLDCRSRIPVQYIWDVARSLDHDCFTHEPCRMRVNRDHALRKYDFRASRTEAPLS